jgi:predicted acyltransferase
MHAMAEKQITSARFTSLDLFRGLTVALMFIVNMPGDGATVYTQLDHAEWHGLTLADLVFPWFLVAVGAAVPLAIEARRAKGMGAAALARQIIWRGFLLFMIGMAIGWMWRPRYAYEDIRFAGVLQRIALVYAASGLIYLATGARPLIIAALTAVILLLSWFLLTHVTVPGFGTANLQPGTNFFAWTDQQFLPGRLYKKTWDPEGVGSTLPSLASSLCGMALLCWLRTLAVSRRALMLLIAGGVLIAGGAVWSLSLPLNKNLWTSSYVLLTSGLAFVLWGCLDYFNLDTRRGITRWILVLGQTALTAYIVHAVWLRVLITKIDDVKIGAMLFAPAAALFSDPRLPSLLYACAWLALCVAPMPWLQRKGWLVKV